MSYGRSAPGPWPTLVIVIVATVLMVVDHRRMKRARTLNEEGRCARCGSVLVGPAHRVPIAGGPRFVRTGYVCDACEAKVKIQERIVWSLLVAGVVFVLLLEWKRTHP
jgi:DNA-directed RNA polymerase subunit RPC12/RpoP